MIDTALIDTYISDVQAKVNERFARSFPNVTVPTISVSYGRKYARIISADGGAGRSVHSFIDLETGDVLKADSWKRPARHARGNLLNADRGMDRVGEFGPAYLR